MNATVALPTAAAPNVTAHAMFHLRAWLAWPSRCARSSAASFGSHTGCAEARPTTAIDRSKATRTRSCMVRSIVAARYLIGIDLGTTNSAVAYVDTRAADPRVRVFEVPQLVAPGEVA